MSMATKAAAEALAILYLFIFSWCAH